MLSTIPRFCRHALLSQHAVLCFGLRYKQRTDRTSSSLPQDEQISRLLFHEYEGLQTFCKYDDSSNVCRTSEASCDGKACTSTVYECQYFIPFIRGRRMKKRKEDEEEEGREVTLCWFDEVMQEQLLPLASWRDVQMLVVHRPSVLPSMIKLHPSDNNPTSPGNSSNPQFLPKGNSPFFHPVLLPGVQKLRCFDDGGFYGKHSRRFGDFEICVYGVEMLTFETLFQ